MLPVQVKESDSYIKIDLTPFGFPTVTGIAQAGKKQRWEEI